MIRSPLALALALALGQFNLVKMCRSTVVPLSHELVRLVNTHDSLSKIKYTMSCLQILLYNDNVVMTLYR